MPANLLSKEHFRCLMKCIQKPFLEVRSKQWMIGLSLFFAPLSVVLLAHLFKPVTLVHVTMDQLLKKCAVHGAKAHGRALDQDSSFDYAQRFKGCVEGLAHKKRWIITDVRGCWGDPKTMAKIKNVTNVVEQACCGIVQ